MHNLPSILLQLLKILTNFTNLFMQIQNFIECLLYVCLYTGIWDAPSVYKYINSGIFFPSGVKTFQHRFHQNFSRVLCFYHKLFCALFSFILFLASHNDHLRPGHRLWVMLWLSTAMLGTDGLCHWVCHWRQQCWMRWPRVHHVF